MRYSIVVERVEDLYSIVESTVEQDRPYSLYYKRAFKNTAKRA